MMKRIIKTLHQTPRNKPNRSIPFFSHSNKPILPPPLLLLLLLLRSTHSLLSTTNLRIERKGVRLINLEFQVRFVGERNLIDASNPSFHSIHVWVVENERSNLIYHEIGEVREEEK